MATVEELEKRIQVLEDVEAIKRLKARYAQLCDDKYSNGMPKSEAELSRIAKIITDLFTEDAIWDGGSNAGIFKGKKEIYEHFKKASLNFAVHYYMAPHITVDGNKARGRWYLFLPATLSDNTAIWQGAFQDDEYTKVDGKWLLSRIKSTTLFMAPYDQGWARKKD